MSEPSEKVICRDGGGAELRVGDTVERVREDCPDIMPLGWRGVIKSMVDLGVVYLGVPSLVFHDTPGTWGARNFRLVKRAESKPSSERNSHV